jgi:threonine dehydrogenase-like Zn-dependent dehydrogenase
MKAGLLFGPGDLRVVDAPLPEPGPDDAILRIMRFAPYGTDIATFQKKGGRYVATYPTGFGADIAGVVTAIGANVKNIRVGDRVSALALAHCGHCANCRKGRTNLCLDPAFRMPPRMAVAQEFARLQARQLARLPDGVSFDDAAMLGGIVDALNAWGKMKPEAGEPVAIVGVGAMGWGAIATARALGHPVIAIGGTGKRVDLARACGADHVVPITAYDEDVSAQVLALAPGGVGAIMETSATDWGVKQCFKIAAPGARIVTTGAPGGIPASGWEVVGKELAIFGSRAGHDQEGALRLIAAGKIDLKPTITHRMPLADLPKAFSLLTGPDSRNVGRIMIDVSDL